MRKCFMVSLMEIIVGLCSVSVANIFLVDQINKNEGLLAINARKFLLSPLLVGGSTRPMLHA